MAELRRREEAGGLYERLLQRLALALEEADSASRLHQAAPLELELSGLTPAEMQLIRAYLDRDLNWLRGWHAAAEELAVIEQAPAVVTRAAGKLPPRAAGKAPVRGKSTLKKRQPLCCALCGAAAQIQRGEGVLPCVSCGSKLFRAGQPR